MSASFLCNAAILLVISLVAANKQVRKFLAPCKLLICESVDNQQALDLGLCPHYFILKAVQFKVLVKTFYRNNVVYLPLIIA